MGWLGWVGLPLLVKRWRPETRGHHGYRGKYLAEYVDDRGGGETIHLVDTMVRRFPIGWTWCRREWMDTLSDV